MSLLNACLRGLGSLIRKSVRESLPCLPQCLRCRIPLHERHIDLRSDKATIRSSPIPFALTRESRQKCHAVALLFARPGGLATSMPAAHAARSPLSPSLKQWTLCGAHRALSCSLPTITLRRPFVRLPGLIGAATARIHAQASCLSGYKAPPRGRPHPSMFQLHSKCHGELRDRHLQLLGYDRALPSGHVQAA